MPSVAPQTGQTNQQPQANRGSVSICGIGICLIILFSSFLPLLSRFGSSKKRGGRDDDHWRGGGFGGGGGVFGSAVDNRLDYRQFGKFGSSSSGWGGSSSGGGDSWGGFGGGGDFGGGGAGGDW